jgi:hypothetical protein
VASETNFVFGDIPEAGFGFVNVKFVKEGGDPDRYSANLPIFPGDQGDGCGPGLVPDANPGDAELGKFLCADGTFQVPAALPTIDVIFVDDEIPDGSIDGVNAVFSLTHSPNPVGCLALFLNGVLQRNSVDYTLSGGEITYAVAPSLGDNHVAYYRTSGEAIAYGEDETPTGSVDGTNTSFSLANAPIPAISLKVYLNGLLQRYGIDYFLAGTEVTFVVAPSSGDNVRAWYRYTGAVASTQFIDDETPSGAIDSSNVAFSLSHAPAPAASLSLYLNGDLLRRGTDYTIAGPAITFTVAPSTGDNVLAFYRADETPVSFADDIIPTGSIDGLNATFVLPRAPSPSTSLKLSLNGVRLRPMIDYSIAGATITYVNPPSLGDNHYADYRY